MDRKLRVERFANETGPGALPDGWYITANDGADVVGGPYATRKLAQAEAAPAPSESRYNAQYAYACGYHD